MEASQRVDDLLSLAGEPLGTYLRDPQVTEVMCNPNDTCFLSRVGKGMMEVESPTEAHLDLFLSAIADVVGKAFRASSPRLAAAIPGAGWRIQAGRPPASSGFFLCLRKHPRHIWPLENYEEKGVFTTHQRRILEQALDARQRIVFAGAVGSAKTSILNASLHYLRDEDIRVIIVEQEPEIICHIRNRVESYVIDGESTLRSLVQDTLRLFPSLIVVGECRGGEALDMLRSFQTGHSGMTTLHVDLVENTFSRLSQLVQEVSVSPQHDLIAQVVDLVVHTEKTMEGFRCTGMMKVHGHNHGEYITEKIA
jgi:type IV secretion system protein VirB11